MGTGFRPHIDIWNLDLNPCVSCPSGDPDETSLFLFALARSETWWPNHRMASDPKPREDVWRAGREHHDFFLNFCLLKIIFMRWSCLNFIFSSDRFGHVAHICTILNCEVFFNFNLLQNHIFEIIWHKIYFECWPFWSRQTYWRDIEMGTSWRDSLTPWHTSTRLLTDVALRGPIRVRAGGTTSHVRVGGTMKWVSEKSPR